MRGLFRVFKPFAPTHGLLRGVPPHRRQGQVLRANPAVSPTFRAALVQAGRYPTAGFGLDGFPPLIGAGLDRVAIATLKH